MNPSRETRRAWAALRALARPYRFRIVADGTGRPMIPGRQGRIECHEDGQELVVASATPRAFARLWAISGVRKWHVGDEVRAVFPFEQLHAVAGVIVARRAERPGRARA